MQPKMISHSKILFKNQQKIAVLKLAIDADFHSSYSFVIATAEYMNTINLFTPPNFTQNIQDSQNTTSFAKQDQKPSSTDYYELWADYVFSLLVAKKVIVGEQFILFISDIDEQRFKIIEKSDLFSIKKLHKLKEEKQQNKIISKALNLKIAQNSHENKKNKVALINFANSVLNTDKFKPKMHLEGLLSGIFYKDGDQYTSYKILRGEIPTYEELIEYDTIILSGSAHSVNELPAQFVRFKDILTKVLSQDHKIKILGICFGHQFIATCYDVKVQTKTLTKGPKNIQLSVQELDVSYFKEVETFEFRHLRLYKYHTDHVQQVPQGFIRYGSSKNCENEIFISKNKQILSFQFHPEYTKQYIQSYEKRVNAYNKEPVMPQEEEKIDEHHHKSVILFQKGINLFLRSSISE